MDTTNSREMELEVTITTFDMDSLSTHLPEKRKGLSRYFSGKMRSFTCLDDAKSVEDLRKAEIPEAKRRKYSDRQAAAPLLPTASCRNESGSTSYRRSCV